MTRSTLLYFGMLLLTGGGFAGIRHVGNTLVPPRHIAGEWQITAASSFSACPILEFDEAEGRSVLIEQSGRYVVLIFRDAHTSRLRAYFDNGVLRGSGKSSIPCAMDTQLFMTGRLKNDRLEMTLTRSEEPLMPTAAALILVATRTPNAARLLSFLL